VESRQPSGEMVQGTLDMLILRTLVVGPAHGHTIANVIERECAGSRTGVAVSRTPSAGRSGVGEFLLGPEREQSQGKILQTHGLRQKAIDRADGALALARRCHRQGLR
jgi:hypothetical protein